MDYVLYGTCNDVIYPSSTYTGNKVLLSYDPTWNALIEHYKRNYCLVKSSEFPGYLD